LGLAADLFLLCDIKRTSEGGSQTNVKRRVELTFEGARIRFLDNSGSGFRQTYEGTFTRETNMRIEFLKNNKGFIDRSTGDFYYQYSTKNYSPFVVLGTDKRHFTIDTTLERGICPRTIAPSAPF
jgi:hypothetical protein